MCAKKKTITPIINFSNNFYSDIIMEDMLYASVVRSPYPKGKILHIETSSIPKDCLFIDYSTVPKRNSISILATELPLFCKEKIDYIGQALGIVTAKTSKLSHSLASSLKINADENFYDELSNDDNILAKREVLYETEEEFSDDCITVEETWESEIKGQNFLEPNGALCYVKDGILYVFSPNQWTANLRENLASVTGFAEEKISITRTKILSKHTNLLYLNTLLACQCAVAAITSKKPVKLEMTRKEQELFAENTSAVKINQRTTLQKNGLIKSMEINIHVNSGAYNPFAQEIADRLAISSTGIYASPNIKINSYIYKSHSIPSSIDFSIIESKAFFAIENQMNKIAHTLGLDPIEFRMINIPNDKKNQRRPFLIETENSQEAVENLCKKSVFLRKYSANKVAEKYKFEQDYTSPFAPPLRGIGLTCAYSGSGFLSSAFIEKNLSVELTMTKDKKILIHSVPPSDDVWKIWQTVASSTTGLPIESIMLDSAFITTTEPDSPQTSNATITITTHLIQKACEALKKKMNSALPVTIKKSFKLNSTKSWDKQKFTGYPFLSTTFAAAIVEVELDGTTFKNQIRGIWLIIDAGKILNAKAAERSLKKSIHEVLASLIEDDEIETNAISIQFIQSNEEPKQIGEIVHSLLPAAYASALSQAAGSTVTELPIQTDTVYSIIKNKLEQAKVCAAKMGDKQENYLEEESK